MKFTINNKEYYLHYSVLGLLVHMVENELFSKLSKDIKHKEPEKFQLINEGIVTWLEDYSDYIVKREGYIIYLRMSEADRELAKNIL